MNHQEQIEETLSVGKSGNMLFEILANRLQLVTKEVNDVCLENCSTDRERLIRSHSSARFCFE